MTRNGINSIKAANKRIMSQRQSDIVELLLIGTPVDQSLVNDDDGQKFRQFVTYQILFKCFYDIMARDDLMV